MVSPTLAKALASAGKSWQACWQAAALFLTDWDPKQLPDLRACNATRPCISGDRLDLEHSLCSPHSSVLRRARSLLLRAVAGRRSWRCWSLRRSVVTGISGEALVALERAEVSARVTVENGSLLSV